MISASLASNFAKPLFEFLNGKKYSVYVKCLEEVLNWAYEFYRQYQHKLNDWDSFEKSKDNIYNAASSDEFLVAWGRQRITQFCKIHIRRAESFYSMEGNNSKAGYKWSPLESIAMPMEK